MNIEGLKRRVSDTFARPNNANAYAVGDVISNGTTVPLTLNNTIRNLRSGWIVGAILSTDLTGIVPAVRCHVYNALPTGIPADNAPFDASFADLANRIGWFDLPAMASPASGGGLSESIKMDLRHPFDVPVDTSSLYIVLESLTIFTPAALQNITLQLLVELD